MDHRFTDPDSHRGATHQHDLAAHSDLAINALFAVALDLHHRTERATHPETSMILGRDLALLDDAVRHIRHVALHLTPGNALDATTPPRGGIRIPDGRTEVDLRATGERAADLYVQPSVIRRDDRLGASGG